MIYERWYNYSKVRKVYTRKHRSSECRKQKRYIEMKDILSNLY
jgi:hypothetical protein